MKQGEVSILLVSPKIFTAHADLTHLVLWIELPQTLQFIRN